MKDDIEQLKKALLEFVEHASEKNATAEEVEALAAVAEFAAAYAEGFARGVSTRNVAADDPKAAG